MPGRWSVRHTERMLRSIAVLWCGSTPPYPQFAWGILRFAILGRPRIGITAAAMPQQTAVKQVSTLRCIMLVTNTGWSMLRFRGPLIEALVAQGFKVAAVADFRPAQLDEVRRLGARPFALPIDAAGIDPRADLRYAIRLYRLLRQIRPDLVNFHAIKPIVYGVPAAKLAGIRGIVAVLTGSGILRDNRRSWLMPLIRSLSASRSPAGPKSYSTMTSTLLNSCAGSW
jgi:hypothetical protein